MRPFALLLLGSLLLTACGTPPELPTDPGGIDQMRPSPCACHPYDYQGGGYRWRG